VGEGISGAIFRGLSFGELLLGRGVYLGFVLFGPIKTHSLAPIKPLKDKPLKDRNNGWAVAES